MSEKKEPAKITWVGALWIVVLAVAISAFLGWEFGKDSGYETGYDEAQIDMQDRIRVLEERYYDNGYEAGYDDGYAQRERESHLSIQDRLDNLKEASEEQSTTVYITSTGEKYHLDGCQYLRQSKIAISLYDAKNQGYTACSRCW